MPKKSSGFLPVKALQFGSRPSKYGAVRTEVDGKRFASGKEAARYGELVLKEKAGLIRDLECQPRFHLVVNARLVCDYMADFTYWDTESGRTIVEDVKSPATRKLSTYRLKVKLMKACLGIDVVEV